MTEKSTAAHRIRLALLIEPVHSLTDAIAFYRRVFELAGGSAPGPSGVRLEIGSVVLLLQHGTNASDTYHNGIVPRLELRVDDVELTVKRWLDAGARVKTRLTGGRAAPPGEPATYAQVLDPYGHLWAFAQHTE